VKRKGGCKDGVKCLNCHLCFWRRDDTKKSKEDVRNNTTAMHLQTNPDPMAVVVAEQLNSTILSAGSQAHPHACGAPCRYVRRKMGCRNGAACPDCHICVWSRNQKKDDDSTGSVHEESDLVLDESTRKLEGLIQLLLQNKAEERNLPIS